MIFGFYEGYNYLDLRTAFEVIAWQGTYGSGANEDPAISSLSNFKNLCLNNGITLEYGIHWQKKGLDLTEINPHWMPMVFFISGSSSKLPLILEWVKKGANLVYIKPEESIVILKGREENWNENINLLSSFIGSPINKENNYIEFGNGQIFYVDVNEINDYEIESGPAGKVAESVSVNKIITINRLLEKISRFNFPIVDICLNSFPKTFPVNEPMFIELKVKNIGNKTQQNTNTNIFFPSEFNSISATYLELSAIRPNETLSIPIICKAIFKGILDLNFRIELFDKSLLKRDYELSFCIEILDNIKSLIGNTISLNIDTKDKIKEIEAYLIPTIDSITFVKLLEVDPDALIAKARKVSEHIVKRIAQNTLTHFNTRWSFSDNIKQLYDNKIITNKIRSYVDTIRLFGNMAAHSSIDDAVQFTIEDGIVVSNALILFILECIKNELL